MKPSEILSIQSVDCFFSILSHCFRLFFVYYLMRSDWTGNLCVSLALLKWHKTLQTRKRLRKKKNWVRGKINRKSNVNAEYDELWIKSGICTIFVVVVGFIGLNGLLARAKSLKSIHTLKYTHWNAKKKAEKMKRNTNSEEKKSIKMYWKRFKRL